MIFIILILILITRYQGNPVEACRARDAARWRRRSASRCPFLLKSKTDYYGHVHGDQICNPWLFPHFAANHKSNLILPRCRKVPKEECVQVGSIQPVCTQRPVTRFVSNLTRTKSDQKNLLTTRCEEPNQNCQQVGLTKSKSPTTQIHNLKFPGAWAEVFKDSLHNNRGGVQLS